MDQTLSILDQIGLLPRRGECTIIQKRRGMAVFLPWRDELLHGPFMPRRRRKRSHDRPHVALFVETSLVAGRHILRGIAQYARECGPWVLDHEPSDLGITPPRRLAEWRGDGIIARLHDHRIAKAVTRVGVPVVDVLGMTPVKGVPLVHVDDAAIARLAAEHLLERGFRQFGCCAVQGANWSQRRCDVFSHAVTAMGYPCSVHYVPEYLYKHSHGDPSWQRQHDRLTQWVAGLAKPVGILAVSDLPGRWVLNACRQIGALVPEELAVVGVDNDETLCEVCEPPLSSVIANHLQVGYEAGRLLDSLMRGKRGPDSPVYVDPAGVAIRRSTDVLAIEDDDVVKAVRFIRERACEGIAVSDVFEHVLISPTSLKRRFRAALRQSIHDAIIAERIKYACRLLSESTMPLNEIARRAGFGTQSYLGVVFKARTGKTPAQHRKEMRF